MRPSLADLEFCHHVFDLYKDGTWTQQELADKFDTSQTTIWQCIDRVRPKGWTKPRAYQHGGGRIAGKYKLTPEERKEIVEIWESDVEISQKELGELYGVTQPSVSYLIKTYVTKDLSIE